MRPFASLLGGKRKIKPDALAPVRAQAETGEAGRQAAAIADRMLAEVPDLPLHRAIRIARGPSGDLAVHWTHADGDAHNRVRVSQGHLFDDGVADMEEAVRWIMGEELRRIAIAQAGPGHEDPVWGVMASPLLVDVMAMLRIALDNPATSIAARIARAVKQRGGEAELQEQDRHVTGTVTPRNQPGRPWFRVATGRGETDRLVLLSGTLPDTVVEALPGRTLSAVVDLGPASADMRIASASHDGVELRLTLAGPAVPLVALPDGIERRWIGPLGMENASI